jgi:hypothetical protein
MAETLISPGVLARENDTSFVSSQPVNVGAAIIGPTVKGPVEIPTIVTSYSDYVNKFGDVLTSGSDTYSYFTSIAAYSYFLNGGETMLVSRVVSGTFSYATSSTIANNVSSVAGGYAVGSFQFSTAAQTGSGKSVAFEIGNNTYYLSPASFEAVSNPLDYAYFNVNGTNTWDLNAWGTSLASMINNTSFDTSFYLTASWNGVNTLNVSSSTPGASSNGINLYVAGIGIGAPLTSMTLGTTLLGGFDGISADAFTLETLSEGVIMNSNSPVDSQGALASGSTNNLRWQITAPNTSSGTFSLLIRQGNDNTNNPIVLETWTNISLDPKSPNYISKVIGDYVYNYNPTTNQIEVTGNYPNNSRYVRVKSVNYPTPDFFDNAGNAKPQYQSYIPLAATGAFGNAVGDVRAGANFYNTVTSTNTQGVQGSDYTNMINLLSNQDDYRFNALFTPGLFSELHTSQVNTIIANTQERGDNIYVVDLVDFGDVSGNVVNEASALNTSYAAAYWPWVQIKDPSTGKNIWVPASTVIAGVYAYNDRVAEPWFAPAGINRGGLGQVIRAEQKLPQATRDTLYLGKVNPIATFPGTGVVVYGQKTLQTQASALDRVNVRRLLIALKSYISQVANNLVFEQNTISTRNQFLAQVNPYLESVQQRQGLYAFKVIMDESNNTPDVIDRNQLVGQIYLQPTKTAEFIYLDFNVTPTGATFPG